MCTDDGPCLSALQMIRRSGFHAFLKKSQFRMIIRRLISCVFEEIQISHEKSTAVFMCF